MKLRYISILALVGSSIFLNCSSDTTISGSGNDSTIVLLSHSFNRSVNPSEWIVYHSDSASAYIDEDGVLYIESATYPGGIMDPGYLLSKNSREVNEDDEYLITLRCSVCLCCAYSSNIVGLKCNGDSYYSGEDFGVGFWGLDYGTFEEIKDDIADSMLVIGEYEGAIHTEGFHVYEFRISKHRGAIRIDGVQYYEISDTLEKPFMIDSFMVYVLASSFISNHCVGIDWVRIEIFIE